MDASDGAIAKQIYDGANKASTFIIDNGQHMHENDGYCFKMAIAVGILIGILFWFSLVKEKLYICKKEVGN